VNLNILEAIRHQVYGCFERSADALMELTDALPQRDSRSVAAGAVALAAVSPQVAQSLRSLGRWADQCAALERGLEQDLAARAYRSGLGERGQYQHCPSRIRN